MIRGGNILLPAYWPQTCACGVNLLQKRTSFYNRWPHGPMRISNPAPNYHQWIKDFFGREGWEWFKGEVDRTVKKPFRTLLVKDIPHDTPIKFEDFDSDEAIKRWKPVADSDSLNGFSVSKLVRSPAGHALFTGIIDNRLPNDGMTANSGFVGIIGPLAPRDKILQQDTHWDWSEFNSIEIKFRGDGRKYMLVINISSYNDEYSYYDTFNYPLYTRGGPYWQVQRIPFSKFFWCNKGFIQDNQGPLLGFHVKFVAVTLEDKKDGPFELEIDYLALARMLVTSIEITAYESYSFPHVRYRNVQVDCAPPDQDE